MENILMLSGGKDSTAVAIRAKLSGEFVFDEYVFCDTGKEFPQMYDHLDRLEEYLDIKITRLREKRGFDYWFGEHVKTKGNNIGQVGYSWPDLGNRWCTAALKRDVARRYLKGRDCLIFEGIAIDEWNNKKDMHRAQNNATATNKRYPLAFWGMSEKECLALCYEHGFEWGGLYEDFGRVSCYCCPLSSKPELYTLWSKYPELWQATKDIEKCGTYRTFRPTQSLDDLEREFTSRNSQMSLF